MNEEANSWLQKFLKVVDLSILNKIIRTQEKLFKAWNIKQVNMFKGGGQQLNEFYLRIDSGDDSSLVKRHLWVLLLALLFFLYLEQGFFYWHCQYSSVVCRCRKGFSPHL